MVMQRQNGIGYIDPRTDQVPLPTTTNQVIQGTGYQPAPVVGPTGPPAPTNASPLDPSTGLENMTGFAANYTPALAGQAYENPWYILPDVFPGISTSSPMFQALRDIGADPLTLFNLIQGSQQKIDQGASPFINWLANMYEQQGTRGGQTFDANQLIKTLFGQTEFGADSQNSLGQILGAGDMSTQIRTLFNMARDVSGAAMNPLAARGYQSAIAQAGDKYGNEQMKAGATETMNPSQWIAENMPWLAGR